MEAPEVPCLEAPPTVSSEGSVVPCLHATRKATNWSWVPKGMDNLNACRIAVAVGPYVEIREDGKDDYHVTDNFQIIIDRSTTNMKDLLVSLSAKVKLGRDQCMSLTFWDKKTSAFTEITTDSQLIAAIDMYWDVRKLPLCVIVPENEQNEEPLNANADVEAVGDDNAVVIVDSDNAENANVADVAWVDDCIEYVGLNDETPYIHLLSDAESGTYSDYEPSDDDTTDDELNVDDMDQCESTVHVINLENPNIAVGVTFQDGKTFKKAIRQHAVLNEFEIIAPYSETMRYRGRCKAKGCIWSIHASQLQDGRTWEIKKLGPKHNCTSTSQVDQNCMATNAWVRDRSIDLLRETPSLGAAALKAELEKKYSIKLSYYVVWDGRQMALEDIMGTWDDSFEDAFNFKAEVERTNPGSLVDIAYEQVGKKMRFTKMFVALKSCVDGFLKGCRPFLGVDSTVLTGRWKGQLATATAIDGHNWMFPVAYGIFDSESGDNWKWLFERLHMAIGSPPGLVISTDTGKGIDIAVTKVFSNGVEHRECMRHLVKNFQKRYRGDVFQKHMWPACRAYNKLKYEYHYNTMKAACPDAIKWIEENHKHLWNRCKFSHASKCDYVTNNIAETFNSWIRKEKSLPAIALMDKIRQLLMEKQQLRGRLARKMKGKILPHIIRDLNAKSRKLPWVIHKGLNDTAEIEGTDRNLITWRHTVDLSKRECSCQEWQITGLPCRHALCYICSKRNPNMEDYVDYYYSVDMFKKAYEGCVMPMTDRRQWPKVDLGFKLWPPILKRTAGRPRERRIRGVEEGGRTTRQMKCRRCGQFGHMMKTCDEPVYDSDAPPPAPPKPKRIGSKKAKLVVASIESSHTTAINITQESTIANSPAGNTRSHDTQLELGGSANSPAGNTRSRTKLLVLEGCVTSSARQLEFGSCASSPHNAKGKAQKLKPRRKAT